MPTALRYPEPVTIEGFDAFIDAQADTADFELIEGVIRRTRKGEEMFRKAEDKILAVWFAGWIVYIVGVGLSDGPSGAQPRDLAFAVLWWAWIIVVSPTSRH